MVLDVACCDAVVVNIKFGSGVFEDVMFGAVEDVDRTLRIKVAADKPVGTGELEDETVATGDVADELRCAKVVSQFGAGL